VATVIVTRGERVLIDDIYEMSPSMMDLAHNESLESHYIRRGSMHNSILHILCAGQSNHLQTLSESARSTYAIVDPACRPVERLKDRQACSQK
jgi:hypothetical protein